MNTKFPKVNVNKSFISAQVLDVQDHDVRRDVKLGPIASNESPQVRIFEPEISLWVDSAIGDFRVKLRELR
jgi:hypothetical protein